MTRSLNNICLSAMLLILMSCGGTNDSTPVTLDNETAEMNLSTNEDFCLADEIFDEEEGVCLIDCTGLSDGQCDALVDEIYGEFDELVDGDYSALGSMSGQEMMDADTAVAKYNVSADLTLTEVINSEPENGEIFKEIWQSAVAILPRSVLIDNVDEFHIDSDGVEGTLAYVVQLPNDNEKWILSYDNADYTNNRDKEYVHTSIHEFGHIVFLERNQVDLNSMGSCPNFAIDEGCTKANSFLNQFYQAFWTEIIEENRAATQASDDNMNDELVLDFYEKYNDQFISEYAATNPIEDAAEVFTHFVLKDKPTDVTGIANQKIVFLYQFQALTDIRNTIRSKLFNRESES